MEQTSKIKVAMVCNMSNPMVRSHLPLDDGHIYNRIRKILGMAPKDEGFHDYAMWNTFYAEEFGKRDDVDLTIVAVHANMKKLKVSFIDGNVRYIFLNFQWASLIKRLVKNRDLWIKINPFAKLVKKEIKHINPDVIILMGLENAYYSGTVLGIKDYPVYALCQTIYNNPARKLYGDLNQDNSETELRLFNELQYVGVFCKMHYDLARQLSPQSNIFKFGGFPTKTILLSPTNIEKEYDFVNFSMSMSKGKGYYDSIQALAIVKKKYPQVKLNLIGLCSDETKAEFNRIIEELELSDNVVFTPFFAKQSDLFLHIQKSRIALLPCKLDNTSGTMTQAMQLGLPIVVYKTSGTSAYNRFKKCAQVAEMGDVSDLAMKMTEVLDNPELARELALNGREWQENKYERDMHIVDHLTDNFRAIIDNFRNGTPIPEEQLFNPELDD